MRVLLVDSDLALLRTMRKAAALEGGAVELLTAQAWEQALELMSIAAAKLVVGAVERTTSPALTSLCELQRKGITVAALGPDVPELVRVAASVGIVEYICKPISSAAFLVRVQRLTRSRSSGGRAGLTGFALADLLQLVSMSKQDMTLRVRSGERWGEMVVAGGQLVHAQTGELLGIDAAAAILDWPDSEVSSSPDLPPRATWTAEVALMELLVDAARLRDERRRDQANRTLQRLVEKVLAMPGVLAASLVHLASREEIFGAGQGRERSWDLMLDTLALAAERSDGEQPSEVQLSLGTCDLLGCRLGAAGTALLVWCGPGELRSGTQLALRQTRDRDHDAMLDAFATIGIELGDAVVTAGDDIL